MRHLWYVLDGHEPRPATMEEVVKAPMERTPMERISKVAFTHGPGFQVSTVFLGIDHGYGNSPPVLFETIIFNGPFDGAQRRYYTWDEAVAGHAHMLRRAWGGVFVWPFIALWRAARRGGRS